MTKPNGLQASEETNPIPPINEPGMQAAAAEEKPKKRKINLDACRSSDEDDVAVERPLTFIKVGKPDGNKGEWVRIYTDPSYSANVGLYTGGEKREHFLVADFIARQLPKEVKKVTLYTAIVRETKTVFLWPVPRPSGEARDDNSWNISHRQGADLARETWIRMSSNRAAGLYEIIALKAKGPDLEPPTHSFEDYLEAAFGDRYIDDMNHVIIQQLLGNM